MQEYKDMRKLSEQRIKDNEGKYKDTWKKFKKEQLLTNIEEEIADVVSYLGFYEKLFNVKLDKYKDHAQQLYKEIYLKLTEDTKNVPLDSFVVGKVR